VTPTMVFNQGRVAVSRQTVIARTLCFSFLFVPALDF
jgi:hypothetical protein